MIQPRIRSWREGVTGVLGVLALAAVITACGGQPASQASTSPPAEAAPPATGAAPATAPAPAATAPVTTPMTASTAPATPAPPTSLGPTTTAPAPAVAACLSSDLFPELSHPNGYAGGVYFQLQLLNHGTTACMLYGYPGVSFVQAAGKQVGAPAARLHNGQPVVTVILQPGQTAVAGLQLVDVGNYPPTCQASATMGLRIYPPGETAALFLPTTGMRTCANTSYTPLAVGPVGGL